MVIYYLKKGRHNFHRQIDKAINCKRGYSKGLGLIKEKYIFNVFISNETLFDIINDWLEFLSS